MVGTKQTTRIPQPTLRFYQIQETLHTQIAEDARARARSLVNTLSNHPITGQVQDKDLIASVRELDTMQNTARLREAYEAHVKYAGTVNHTGHWLANRAATSYISYDPATDKKFFNMR